MDDLTKIPKLQQKKCTPLTLKTMKDNGVPISMLTAYDYPTALALENAGIDGILVGDSMAMVVLGYENTLPLTMDAILPHCQAVARGVKNALLIGDMPFMSYQVSVEEAVRNAGRFLQEGGMDAVKLEGGSERINTIRSIVSAGIPVMGHIGLTPQSFHLLGGFHPQARTAQKARLLVAGARLLEDAGCFCIVLESIPARLAEYISQSLSIPTIGIGAGVGCDGQILVTHDLLGLYPRFTPLFVKKYAKFFQDMETAFSCYVSDVRGHKFPTNEHSIDMPDSEWRKFTALTKEDENA